MVEVDYITAVPIQNRRRRYAQNISFTEESCMDPTVCLIKVGKWCLNATTSMEKKSEKIYGEMLTHFCGMMLPTTLTLQGKMVLQGGWKQYIPLVTEGM